MWPINELTNTEEWVHLVDNHNASHGSARYRNTGTLAPRLVIISSNVSPLEFFYYAKNIGGGDRSESLDKFFRRLTMHMVVLRPDEWGYYNFRLLPVQHVPAYSLEAPGSCSYNRQLLNGLEWKHADPEDMVYSPYGSMVRLVELIDERCGGILEAEGRLDDALQTARDAVWDAFMPKGKPLEHMPALPPADELADKTSWLEHRRMHDYVVNYEKDMQEQAAGYLALMRERQEYEEYLFGLACAVHAHETVEQPLTFEDWRGGRIIYDPDLMRQLH